MTTRHTDTDTVTVTPAGDIYSHYPGQSNPQPCYVELDCGEGVLSVESDPEVGGGVSADGWNNRTHQWSIPCLNPQNSDLLLREIAPLAQRVLSGYECEWDGSNHVGRLDVGANAASGEIESICAARHVDLDGQVEVMDADVYWESVSDEELSVETGITATSPDGDVEKAAEVAEEVAANEHGIDVLEGAEEYLTELRNRLADEDVDDEDDDA